MANTSRALPSHLLCMHRRTIWWCGTGERSKDFQKRHLKHEHDFQKRHLSANYSNDKLGLIEEREMGGKTTTTTRKRRKRGEEAT